MSVVDDYFAGLDADARTAFERVRDIAVEEAPGATAGTSYGMAALVVQGRPLLGFKAARAHLSVFPFSPQAVDAARDQLGGFDLAKGTVRFTAARPLPDGAVRALVRARLAEISGAA